MHLLITGGAGFIGSNLVRLALANNHQVTVLDNLSTGDIQNIEGLDIDFVQGSILEVKALRHALKDVQSVIHLAALGSVPRSVADPITSHLNNATGTLKVLNAARQAGVGHATVASSSSVYGMNPALPKSEREWVRPMSPYAVSKLATEQYALAFQQSYNMSTMAFRFFNVYGPRQMAGHVYAAVIPLFISALLRDEPLWVNGDGSNSRDFTYVGTVCEVLLEASEKSLSHPEPVNLAFSTNTTLLQLVKLLEEKTGKQADIRFRQPRPGDVAHSQADNTVLRSLFPEIESTPLGVGIEHTIAWFKGNAK